MDSDTGIRVSKYGPHFFHTNDEEVWEYVNNFTSWTRFDVKIMAAVDDRIVPVPVNMETINVLCDKNYRTEEEVTEFLQSVQECNAEPANSEEVALKRVGRVLYEKIFLPYTVKQWNQHPRDLDPSVLARIPVRTNNDCRYFSDKYQAIPTDGYTGFFTNLLEKGNIDILLNWQADRFDHSCLIFTGPIDSYFHDAGLPKLQYRSLKFTYKTFHDCPGFHQQNLVINYPSALNKTRCVEYKHLPYKIHANNNSTILVEEMSSDVGEPYYPVPNKENISLYESYKSLAANESNKNVHFIGRLANYKYFNMDEAIKNALSYFKKHFE